MQCPECQASLIQDVNVTKNFYQLFWKCSSCRYIQFDEPILKSAVSPPKPRPEYKPRPPSGLTPKECRQAYAQSKPGKAAIKRYQDSILFREAHAKHRQTEKYKQTQRRYKLRQAEYERLANPHSLKVWTLDLKVDAAEIVDKYYRDPESLTAGETHWMRELFTWAWYDSYIDCWEPNMSDQEVIQHLAEREPGRYKNLCYCLKQHFPELPEGAS